MLLKTLLPAAFAAALALPVVAASGDALSDAEWEALYQQALALRASGDLYGAIEGLNSLLTSRPSVHRARLELAVAYYRAAHFGEAEQQARAVLAGDDVPDNVRDTIGLFLAEIEGVGKASESYRHTFSSSLNFGGGYDDNVNAGPSSSELDVNGFRFLLDPDSLDQSDSYATVSGRINHNFRFDSPFELGSLTAQAMWQTNASVYHKGYQDETGYNVEVLSLATGPALISRSNWRASLPLQVDYVRLGSESLATYVGLNPSVTFVDGVNEYTLRGQVQQREYNHTIDKGREGNRYALGADYGHTFSSALSLQTGLTFSEQDARNEYQAYDKADVYLGLYWMAWTDGLVYGRADYAESDYDNLEPLFNKGRTAEETSFTLGLSHNFTSGALQGWGVSARANHFDADANVGIYEYDRTDLSVDFSRSF